MIVRQLETRLTAGDNAPQSLSNIKNAIQSMAELYLDAKGPGAWRLRWFWMFFFSSDFMVVRCELWHFIGIQLYQDVNSELTGWPGYGIWTAVSNCFEFRITAMFRAAVDLASGRFPRKCCGNGEIHHGVKKSWFNLNIEYYSVQWLFLRFSMIVEVWKINKSDR